MAEAIIMPKLAMAMQEGTVVEYLAREGAWVEKGAPVMTVETEKVTYECEAPAAGYLHILVAAGETVPVFDEVGLLADTEGELAQLATGRPLASQPDPASLPSKASKASTASTASALVTPTAVEARPANQGRPKISPIAKKMARQHDLDVSQIAGTGPGGRIVKGDVERALAGREGAAQVQTVVTPVDTLDGRRVRATVPLQGMRKAIAQHMHRSLAVSAQMSTMGEIDMTELIRLREILLRKEEETGVRISFTDLYVLVLAKAVNHVPIVNSSLVGEEIKIWQDVNVGVAVALQRGEYESGLIVPVVKNADHKSLIEISRAVKELTARARSGELTPEDVDAGTITLSNAGMIAQRWMVSTPILNQPETVIVQPGAIVERPVVVDGELQVRPMMTMSITSDHRVLDGVPVTRFFNRIAELIENPALLHL
ncbi:dihydrolipoamide acetyltransferase family protein [Chloroflexota bacterium]